MSVASDLYVADHHWGATIVDVGGHDLPALKASYLLDRLPQEGRVLEVGCGGGRLLNTIALHRPGIELFGCDVRALPDVPRGFNFSVVRPDDARLPYDDAAFDAVVMFDVLEHVLDPAATLLAARRVLRPGGRLVSFTPLEGQRLSFYRLYRRLFGDDLYVRTKEHVQAYSARYLVRLVREVLDLTDVQYAYHLLGHLMDATLFAALAMPRMGARFWAENPFYAETAEEARRSSRTASLLRAANAVAYHESRLLRHSSFAAAGMLFTAVRR